MTIREVENRSGLTRANIRFYESEGLLNPQRLPNGYRDYSDEDLAALKKIRLLRQLNVPIDDIRALQSGEQALSDALQRCLHELEHAQNELQKASAVCRAMMSDGATYQTLDADRYLAGAVETPRPASSRGLRFDVPHACPHPWRRFLARWLDLVLYGLLWSTVNTLVFCVNPALRSTAGMLLDSFVTMLIMLFAEPLFLHFLGYTPGKFLFGLRVTDHGRRLSYFDALCRTGSVIASGEGLFIPIYQWVRNYKCYKKCKAGEVLPWEEDYEYELTDTAWWRIPAFAAACAVWVGIAFCIVLAGDLPQNRGALTAAGFAENYNDYAAYLGARPVLSLNADGTWSERNDTGVIHVGALDSAPAVTFIETDGVLSGVQLEFTHTGQPFLTAVSYQDDLLLAALSFVCAQPDVGFFEQVPRQLAERLTGLSPFSSWCFEMAGVELCCTAEVSGYLEPVESVPSVLVPDPDEEQTGQSFHLIFTMTKIN